ncbi:hypothetical protein DU508_01005 [Pedobacter chinensis]|uniref:Signal transduction histidine kinase internal region domain-containing protein n=1 Tax=Pedobacter chinensis TaxID=2282421 RepID=A0A369Q5P6_9SPHI|nr:histidine kinase [Pedobacter chinensis]RDC58607.1 hypothetical protein DU508_01005 [Pedobacter chinensis]
MGTIKKTKPTLKYSIRNWLIAKKFHIIIWIVFIIYESVIIGLFTGKFGKLSNYIFYYALNVTIFYVHTHVVLSKGLKNTRKVWWKLPLFLTLEIIGYLLVTFGMDYLVINFTDYDGPRKMGFNMPYLLGPVYRAIYFMFFSTGYYFLLKFLSERKKTEDLELQRLNNMIQIARSENAFLRAQVQPHLLFNTLDFIYQNAKDTSPIAAETILSLSEMMRYSVDSNKDKDFIPLAEEINQVENFINLHQLRKNHQLQIRFWYDDEIKEIEIIPLVLITLTENMIKHGNLLLEAHPAEIKLSTDHHDLIIETSNLINVNKENSGLNAGIENITKRLNYAYGDGYSFDHYANQNHYFIVKLIIKNIVY